jgi:hypothetical protein
LLSLAFIGDKPIWERSSNSFFNLLLLQGFLMAHMTSNVQVLNVTKWEYSPFNNKLGMTLTIISLTTFVLSFFGITAQ